MNKLFREVFGYYVKRRLLMITDRREGRNIKF